MIKAHSVSRRGLCVVFAIVVAVSGVSCTAGTSSQTSTGQTQRQSTPERETDLAQPTLSAEAQVVYERLLVRDRAPECTALVVGQTQPSVVLLELVDKVRTPPTVGMRAAQCLLEHYATLVEPRLQQWVSQAAYKGYGLLTLNLLDRLEVSLAQRLARSALRGEYAPEASVRIARSQHARTVLEELVPGGAATTR